MLDHRPPSESSNWTLDSILNGQVLLIASNNLSEGPLQFDTRLSVAFILQMQMRKMWVEPGNEVNWLPLGAIGADKPTLIVAQPS